MSNFAFSSKPGTNRLSSFVSWQTPPQEIEKYILEELRLQIRDKLQGLDILISARLKELLSLAIQRCELYQALVNRNEKIYFELGAINSPEAMRDLIRVVQNTVYVAKPIVRKLGNRLNMSIGCSAINKDFSEELALGSGKYISTNKKGETTEIPWLQWLLSSPPFIRGWDVMFSNDIKGSRTGGAIMIQVHKDGWKLPIEFAGTLNDNFVTRAINEYNVSGQLDLFIQQTIEILLR